MSRERVVTVVIRISQAARIHTAAAVNMDPELLAELALEINSAVVKIARTRVVVVVVVSLPSRLHVHESMQSDFVLTFWRLKDSKAGKFMEKVGGMLGNDTMEQKGLEKREQAGYGGDNY